MSNRLVLLQERPAFFCRIKSLRLSKDGLGVTTSTSHKHLVTLLLSLVMGCRHASVHDDPNWPSAGPVDVASLPPIHSVINRGTTDPAAVLANREPAAAKPNRATDPIMLGSLNGAAGQTAQPSAAPEVQPPSTTAEVVTTPAPAVALAAEPQQSLPPPVQPTPEQPLPALAPNLPKAAEASAPPPLAGPQTVDTQAQPASAQMAPPSAGPVSGTAAKGMNNAQGFDLEGLSPTAVSAGRVAANVGKEIITVYDLNLAVQDWIRQNVPAGQTIPRRDGLMIARLVLNQMVDRMLIVQEANRLMKSEKQKDALMKQIELVWKDQQIPPLMKKYKVDTVYDLDQALRKQGKSLDGAKKEFMNDAVAHEFMGMKLNGKTHVSLVEMRRYYKEHMAEFDRPAQLTWREIRVPIENGQTKTAEEKAAALLKKVDTHSDFATVAKQESKGPTADQGGLWETSPGSFAMPEINKALEVLQPGQISNLIVTAQAVHILKLESSRAAGPARFDEVQTVIQNKLREEKLGQASIGFVQELRRQAVIRTIFDDQPQLQLPGTPADGQVQRTNGASPAHGQPLAQPQTAPSPQAQPSGQSAPGETTAQPGAGGAARHKFGLGSGRSPGSDSDDIPPALAPAGKVPPRGMMSGPSGPSPL